MKRLSSLVLLTVVWVLSVRAQELPVSTPEAQGVSSKGLQKLIETLDKKAFGVHGIVVVRHGHVIAKGWWSPYSAEQEHILFSLSKSFTSTAIGMLADEGKLSVSDKVLPFFPEAAPANPSDNLKAMRLRDLLIMGTGQRGPEVNSLQYVGGAPIAKQFLALPVAEKPGTLFIYNTGATYMLSSIVQKVSGKTTLEFLRSRLLEPLGFKDPNWDADAQGVSFGGFGFYARTGDIAKFGQFLLQRGEWQGRRLVSAAWLDQATAKQISNGSDPESDWDAGYGYQFWRCKPGFYRGDGAFGQFCMVMPQYDTVVALNSGARDMGGLMNALWDVLIPELRPAALPADPEGDAALESTLAHLRLPVLQGEPTAPALAAVKGRVFTFDSNFLNLERLELSERDGVTHVSLVEAGRPVEIDIKPGQWTVGPDIPLGSVHSPFAVTGGWTAPDTLTVKVAYTRLTHLATIVCKVSEKSVKIDHAFNLGIAGEDKPVSFASKPL